MRSRLERLRDWITLLPPRETEERAMSLSEWMDSDIADTRVATISQKTATRIATVYACQRVIIDAVSTLPVGPFRRTASGERVPLRPVPEWMLAPHGYRDPNYGMTQYLAELTSSLLTDGNAFVLATPNADERAIELWVLDPKAVEVRREQSGDLTYAVRLPDGSLEDFDGWNIIHIARMRRPGELRGISPIDEARVLLGFAAASQQYGTSWYQRGAVPSAVLEAPGNMTQEQVDDARRRWDNRHAGADRVSVAILTGGMKFSTVGMTFEQAQWVEGMRFSSEQLAAIHGVPLHKVGIATPGAMSYASVEANEIAWVTDTVAPLVETIAKAHDRLLPGRPESYVEISLKGRLRGDTQARAAYYTALYNVGVLSQGDIRALEDLPPIPGGDVYRVPLSLGSGEATATIALGEKAKVAAALVDAGYALAEAAVIVGLPAPVEEPDPEPAPVGPPMPPMPPAEPNAEPHMTPDAGPPDAGSPAADEEIPT